MSARPTPNVNRLIDDRSKDGGAISGYCASEFISVLDAFADNFLKRGEVGGSVCVTIDGETVVDLWGGIANRAEKAPWFEDTISIVFSATKGALALCGHMLVNRGLLDLDAPVAKYWPEYAVNGKEDTRVSMMLDHTAGVPALREPVKPGGVYDWDYMVKRLEQEKPFWPPGTRSSYHGLTMAWTVGELVRRVSGKSVGTFFREEVAVPLGLDFWLGLPEEHESRVARMLLFKLQLGAPLSPFQKALVSDPTSVAFLFFLNTGGFDANSREAHASDIGSACGITNARGLAGMYRPLALGGDFGGVRLLGPQTLRRAGRVSAATHEDGTLLIPARFGLGFMKSMDNRGIGFESAILGDSAFGHVGAGGSIGFADPDCRMSFGYTMNQMGNGILLNDRGQSLVDAAYRCAGWSSNVSGAWSRS